MLIPYASLTTTKQNLAALREANWRLLLSPTGCGLDPRGFRYGLDNGAWTYHQRGEPFDEAGFLRAVDAVGVRADFIVLPDIVMGGLSSLHLSLSFAERLTGIAPLLVPLQDGMTDADIASIPNHLGVFIGGSTMFKERWLRQHKGVAHSRYVHVGRVNTRRRIDLCHDAGVDSFDGTSASRYCVTLPKLDHATRVPPHFQMEMKL